MSRFVYPDWQLPSDHQLPPRPAPLDPELRSEYDTRIEEALNRFIEAQHGALYTDDDAFLRRKSRDAVDGARRMADRLAALKDEMIAGAASDYERRALEERLAPVLQLVQQDIGRHAANQKKVWQREVMDRRMELMRKQAGFRWNDPDALEAYAEAAESAARDRAWIDGLAPDTEELQPIVTAARSGVLRSAIEGALAGGDSEAAHALHQNAVHRLSPDDTDALARQFEAWHARKRGDGTINLPGPVSNIDAAHRLPDAQLLKASAEEPPVMSDDTPPEQQPTELAQLTGTEADDDNSQPPQRGMAPAVVPASKDPQFHKEQQDRPGQRVVLPNGRPIPDPYSPTGYLMSPSQDLSDVAKAGRRARDRFAILGVIDPIAAVEKGYREFSEAIGQGGVYDYQRKKNKESKDGFIQLRQFRDVANFNVGLFCQQAGLPLEVTLRIAQLYAAKNSSNYKPNEPYGLEQQTREFIEAGFRAGASRVFDPDYVETNR